MANFQVLRNNIFIEASNLKVLNLVSGQELQTLNGPPGKMKTVIVTPDGSCVIANYDSGFIKVWDLASGQEIWDLANGQKIHTSDSTYYFPWFNGVITITPDGSRIVCSGNNKDIKILDLTSGKKLQTLSGHSDKVTTIMVTFDGSRVLSASDKTLKVWGLANGQELHTLNGHSDKVTAITVTPNNSRAVSVSEDTTVKVWDLTTGLLLASINLDGSIECCAVTPDSQTIVAGGSNGVHFIRLELESQKLSPALTDCSA